MCPEWGQLHSSCHDIFGVHVRGPERSEARSERSGTHPCRVRLAHLHIHGNRLGRYERHPEYAIHFDDLSRHIWHAYAPVGILLRHGTRDDQCTCCGW